jgi:hypothetical protein
MDSWKLSLLYFKENDKIFCVKPPTGKCFFYKMQTPALQISVLVAPEHHLSKAGVMQH